MKKLMFTLFGLSLFFTSLNAACYVEPVYPGSGPALDAYCWDISYVHSEQHYLNGYDWEPTSYKSSTTYDHGGSFVAAIVDVFGYFDSTTMDLDYDSMTLYQETNIINAYNIKIGTRYMFVMEPNTKSYGMLRAKHYSSMKDQVYFQ